MSHPTRNGIDTVSMSNMALRQFDSVAKYSVTKYLLDGRMHFFQGHMVAAGVKVIKIPTERVLLTVSKLGHANNTYITCLKESL